MLFGIRIHTCRVILLTSLVWFLIIIVVLSFYTECLGSNCKRTGEYDVIVNEALKSDNLVEETAEADEEAASTFISNVPRTYKPSLLHRWKPAPTVLPKHGSPGEHGKPVHIPSDQEAVMKEKFKLNQFNQLASDMMSLNRSLSDVRLEGVGLSM
ncbi:n-acetylgalactosaminyltransferase [Holotrichia oblita]|uniref:N-acetylgalactosaminyltransferase n=1 Tax=Holotrichia oblita TaxID=644536 RepID=A0ACB9SMX8_HOLOL|nr:n-acetylgalactosaminyltransferase [Holotrichia oblita]